MIKTRDTLLIIIIIIDPTIQLKTFQTYMKELERMVTLENNSVHAFLPHINSLLHNAVLTCTAAVSTELPCTEQFKNDVIPSNKKMEHQWQFQKTTKAPGRKKKGLIFKLVNYDYTYHYSIL